MKGVGRTGTGLSMPALTPDIPLLFDGSVLFDCILSSRPSSIAAIKTSALTPKIRFAHVRALGRTAGITTAVSSSLARSP